MNSKKLYQQNGLSFWLLLNSGLVSVILLHFNFIAPHFDDMFCVWKLIMGESGSYTRNYNYSNDLLLLQYLFQWLYGLNPDFSWLPLSFILFTCLSFVLIFNTIVFVAKKSALNTFSVVALLLLVSLIFTPNLMWVHHTRTAFLMCGAALVLTQVTYIYIEDNRLRIYLSGFAVFWFIIGLLFRPEAAIAALLLFTPLLFILANYNLRQTLRQIAFPAMAVMIFIAYYSWNIHYNDSFYYQLEPDVEYEIMDRKNIVPLSDMKTLEDTAKYLAATNWMLGDVNKTTPEFLRSIINKKSSSAYTLNIIKMEQSMFETLQGNKYFLLLVVASFIILFLTISFQKAIFATLWILFGLILLSLSFSINNYDRIVQPFLFIFSSGIVLVLFSCSSLSKKRTVVIILILLFATILLIPKSLSVMYKQSANLSNRENTLQQTINSIIYSHPERKYVAIIGNYFVFNTGVFKPFIGFGDKQLILTEIGQYSCNPEFLKAISKHTGCKGEDFKCRIKFIYKHRSEFIIIAKRQRLELYKNYLMSTYDYHIDFGKSKSQLLQDEVYVWLP